MSNTLDKIRSGENDGVFEYQFGIGNHVVDKAKEKRLEWAEEIADQQLAIPVKYTGNEILIKLANQMGLEDVMNDAFEKSVHDGLAAVVPVRTGFMSYKAQLHTVVSKPYYIGTTLVSVSTMTEELIANQAVKLYITWQLNPNINGYSKTYQATAGGSKVIDIPKLLPDLALDENNTEHVADSTAIPVALVKQNKKGTSAWAALKDSLTVINFYAVAELDDFELAKLKILIDGNSLKWGESEANRKIRKGGVIKMGGKNYTYANPITVVNAALNTGTIITARERHEAALAEAIGAHRSSVDKGAQANDKEVVKADRRLGMKTAVRQRLLTKSFNTFLAILGHLVGLEGEDSTASVELTSYLQDEEAREIAKAKAIAGRSE